MCRIDQTERMRPKIVALSVVDAINQLEEFGTIMNLLVDLDGTIAPVLSEDYDLETLEALIGWRRRPGHSVCLLSNLGTPFLFPRLKKCATRIGARYHGCWFLTHMKPNVEAFVAAMAKIGANPENTAMIGDTLCKDILGANLAGIVSVYTPTIGYPPWWKVASVRRDEKRRERLGIVFPHP